MTWVRIDDGMPDHPKFAEPDDEDAALALWVRALCYCNRNRTDGFVSHKKVSHLSRAADPRAVAGQLVAAGLWEVVDGGFMFHDYAHYQPTKAALEAVSEDLSRKRSEAGRKGNEARWGVANRSQIDRKSIANHRPDPDPDPIQKSLRAPAREEQNECHVERQERNENHGGKLGPTGPDNGDGPRGVLGGKVREHGESGGYGKGGSSPATGARRGGAVDDCELRPSSGPVEQPATLTSGPPTDPPDGQESLLDVLARMVALGEPWAVAVEARRSGRLGRLTEAEKDVLRQRRERDAKVGKGGDRKGMSATDEADVQWIVAVYVDAQKHIIKDSGFVALESHFRDAKAILADARRLAERAARGDWKPTPAQVVAHRLETYLRDPRNKPFALRWLFDRTEQDDLPKPPRAPKAKVAEAPKPEPRRCPTELSAKINAVGAWPPGRVRAPPGLGLYERTLEEAKKRGATEDEAVAEAKAAVKKAMVDNG